MGHTKRRDTYSALLMILIGIGTTWSSVGYHVGTLARMGAGYFPILLGAVLTFLGLLMFVTPTYVEEVDESDQDAGPAQTDAAKPGHLRPWLATVAGMLAFIVLGKYGGLVPATFVLIFVSAQGDRANSVKASLALAAGVTASAVAIFYYGMQMQFPLFNWG